VCTGIVTRGDLLRDGVDPTAPVTTIATANPVTVTPKTLALDALHVMLQDEVEHVPVVADGRLVGICTRTDLLRTRLDQLEQERSQPGWHLPSYRGRPKAAS
jgi:CBS domain-containing protein